MLALSLGQLIVIGFLVNISLCCLFAGEAIGFGLG